MNTICIILFCSKNADEAVNRLALLEDSTSIDENVNESDILSPIRY